MFQKCAVKMDVASKWQLQIHLSWSLGRGDVALVLSSWSHGRDILSLSTSAGTDRCSLYLQEARDFAIRPIAQPCTSHRFLHSKVKIRATSRLTVFSLVLNLLAPELFFFNFSTPVYKMWIIQEPNTLELWNKLHFEDEIKNGEYIPCLKHSVPIFVE